MSYKPQSLTPTMCRRIFTKNYPHENSNTSRCDETKHTHPATSAASLVSSISRALSSAASDAAFAYSARRVVPLSTLTTLSKFPFSVFRCCRAFVRERTTPVCLACLLRPSDLGSK